MTSITIASWNINALRGARHGRLESIAAALARHIPDIVVLQEVASGHDVAENLRNELAAINLPHFAFSGSAVRQEKQYGDKMYGNVIASRWPIETHPWPIVAEWPQLLVSAFVATLTDSIRVVGVHIPNGSANGWEKIYAFEALAEGLNAHPVPTILAGDFNEPHVNSGTQCHLRSFGPRGETPASATTQ